MKLVSYRWADVGQLVPTKAKPIKQQITELWVSHSVKKTIPKHVAKIGSTHWHMWMTWLRNWHTDCLEVRALNVNINSTYLPME